MNTLFLAASFSEMVDNFGLHTEAFIAHFIAFAILAAVVVFFGIKPVMRQLEERRERIREGEAMHARSEQELADVQERSQGIVYEARDQAKGELEHARKLAETLREDSTAKAEAEAKGILENAHQQAQIDARRQEEALRGEFARLLAQATQQVTGKVLTEADHRAINAEAINHLP